MSNARFAFGKNWTEYMRKHITPEGVSLAQTALLQLLRMDSLEGKRVLDIGSGSGIHSLAAHLAGAQQVISFDYDVDSVSTTRALHAQHGSPQSWTVLQGSVLDSAFMQDLGKFDVVYAWGVLHHTGDMLRALRNAAQAIAPDGIFALALYSYTAYENNTVFGQPSPEDWLKIKYAYVTGNESVQNRLVRQYIWRRYFAKAGANPIKLAQCACELFSRWASYGKTFRGMNFLTDVRDWVGGWPMEFMKENVCFDFSAAIGLELLFFQTGRGNTEYLFRPSGATNHWDALLEQRVSALLHPPFAQISATVWQATVPDSFLHDTPQMPFCSPLRLTESGSQLIFPHCHRQALENFGGGRYLHEERGNILFSTSDNTDPNKNGRSYAWYAEHLPEKNEQ